MSQEHAHRNHEAAADEQTAQQVGEAAVEAERKEALDNDIDAVLGDIDDVLETNAEDFVRNYIQKGGQ